MWDRSFEWRYRWEFLSYTLLYVVYWMFMFGIFLLSGFWTYLSCAAFVVAGLVRFTVTLKANSGSFDPRPLKVALVFDVGLLVVSLVLLVVFKVEEPLLYLLVLGSLIGSGIGSLTL